MGLRIAICCDQMPFVRGGAEIQTEVLAEKLRMHGHQAEIIRLPFRWYPKDQILRGYLAWRLIDLEESEGRAIDRVIPLKFPSFVISHPYKVTWLIQQFRQAYDLFGTPYSHFDTSDADAELRQTIHRIDTETLRESRYIFSISRNVSRRLRLYNGLASEPLYPPPGLDGRYYNDGYGDYVFTVCRLNYMKRVDQLIRAMSYVNTPVRCRIAGRGDEFESLKKLARQEGVADRVDFLGYISDEELLAQYAGALAIYYAPYDEDFGLVTLEGMKSGKPILTTHDSGGVLEFVEDCVTGFVTAYGDTVATAQRIDELYMDHKIAERMGTTGQALAAGVNWEVVVKKLLEV